MVAKRLRRKREASTPRITLTPLIDTVLVLLVIFMVATPMMHHSIKVDLPRGESNEADVMGKNLTLFVDSNNQVYVNDVAVPDDAILDIVQQKIGGREDQMVIVNADTRASFGLVMELVDRLKSVGGIRHVAFTLQRPRKKVAA